jgi:HAD superfamily hydrolase (TIGR01549 family)
MTVKGVFFDFYGTLCVLDNMAGELDEWIAELCSHLRKHGSAVTKADVWDYFNQRMRKENPPKPDDGMTIFERRIQIAGSDLGARMSRAEIEHTAEALLAVWDKYARFDSFCFPLLHTLNENGKVIALISNYDHPRHIHELVQKTGMNKHFSAVIVSGDHGIKKPDPAIFRLALQKTGMEPYETIYVGDSEEDIVGANNTNMISVLIDRNSQGYDWGQHYTVNTLQDILRIVF